MFPHADPAASRRVRWLARVAFLWAALILGRLVYLQVFNHAEYRDYALHQQTKLKEVQAPRGAIFDRNERVLAMSVPVETVTVNPRHIKDRQFAAQLLARTLDIDEKQLAERLDYYTTAGKGYMVVARRVDAERAGRLRNLGIDWVRFEPEGLRRYPNGPLGAHLLGSVNYQEEGDAGVELEFEDELGGYPGFEWVTSDVKDRGFESTVQTKPYAGRDLHLTIDRRIQFAADAELKRAVLEHNCQSGTAVVMNPYNGEVLAISNYPTYDPNEPPKSKKDYTARKNLAVTDPFEPGSVFKVFTIAAALETTNITPETRIFCHNGAFRMHGRTIHEAKGGYGELTVEEILAKSSNIGAFKIGMRTGEAKLHEYLMRFGFNQTTGIELPSESAGLVFRLKRWQPTSLGSVSMGHEVLTTSVQLARAMSAIANNGLLVKPHLTIPSDENSPVRLVSHGAEREEPVRILKPETALTMRRMMETVVLRGTGRHIRLDGYTFGAKTGTAQMFDKSTKRYSRYYHASFAGFAPVTNPAVVVVVTLNGSTKYGGVIAGPVFKEITQVALRAMNVPQDNVDPAVFEEQPEPAVVADVADPGVSTSAAAEIHADMEEEQNAQAPEVPTGPPAPEFLGKSLRAVVEEASARGVRIELDGTGIARYQDPPPGARMIAGQKVKVRFER